MRSCRSADGCLEDEEKPGPVDSTKVDWQRCKCGGLVALHGRMVLHDVPSCAEYQQLMRDAGATIHTVKDLGLQ
jgi:hypothetical protein